MSQENPHIPAERFREVLGLYPTGVVAVTALEPCGAPAGMILGTFASVSLAPPLVSFMPDKSSSSWKRLSGLTRYCVNILGRHQETLCRKLASKREDKFDGIEWRPTRDGAPALAGCVAWIDCLREQVIDAGDHHIVLCRVTGLVPGKAAGPLLFHRGGFGTFSFEAGLPAMNGSGCTIV